MVGNGFTAQVVGWESSCSPTELVLNPIRFIPLVAGLQSRDVHTSSLLGGLAERADKVGTCISSSLFRFDRLNIEQTA